MKSRYVFFLMLPVVLLALLMAFRMRQQDHALADLQRQVNASEVAHDEALRSQALTPNIAAHLVAYMAHAALSSTEADKDAGSGSPNIAPAKAELSAVEVHERYESTFAHDRMDAGWTTQARAIADAKLPSLLPNGSSVRAFECRASICRLAGR
jgi:hypothetical protein